MHMQLSLSLSLSLPLYHRSLLQLSGATRFRFSRIATDDFLLRLLRERFIAEYWKRK